MEFTNNKLYLNVKDHSVSGETFELQHDENLDLLITFPKPDAIQLPKYYESENYISHTDGKRTIFEKTYQSRPLDWKLLNLNLNLQVLKI